jgi:hypothetical protein
MIHVAENSVELVEVRGDERQDLAKEGHCADKSRS